MNKVLLTGASGLLGKKLLELLLENEYNVVSIARKDIGKDTKNLKHVQLDIKETLKLEDLLLKERPQIIVHAAAYTNVDACETYRNDCWKTNVEATRSIVRIARVIKSYLIYVSTDYVFDGKKGLYDENDIPNPINFYGTTKLIGEQLVINSDLLYTIVRTSAIYGVRGSKKSFAEFVAERLTNNEEIYAITDQYVSPTLNTLLADVIIRIIEKKPMGIFNVAGPRMNRYEFAVEIAKKLGLNINLIKKSYSEELKSRWTAKRPKDTSLKLDKIKHIFPDIKIDDISIALDIFKREWENAF